MVYLHIRSVPWERPTIDPLFLYEGPIAQIYVLLKQQLDRLSIQDMQYTQMQSDMVSWSMLLSLNPGGFCFDSPPHLFSWLFFRRVSVKSTFVSFFPPQAFNHHTAVDFCPNPAPLAIPVVRGRWAAGVMPNVIAHIFESIGKMASPTKVRPSFPPAPPTASLWG